MSCQSNQSKKKWFFHGIYVLVVGVFVSGIVFPRTVHAAVLDWNCVLTSPSCYIFPTADATEKSAACLNKPVTTNLEEGGKFTFPLNIKNLGTNDVTFACSNCVAEAGSPNFTNSGPTGNLFAVTLNKQSLADQSPGTAPYDYIARFLLSASVPDGNGGTEISYANLCVAVKKTTQAAPPTQPTTKAPVVDIKSTFPSITDLNPLRTTSVPTLFGRAIKILLGVLGSIAIVLFMYGGVMWMTSMGNADRADKGLKTIVWGSMGIFVIFSSYAVVQFILGSFK